MTDTGETFSGADDRGRVLSEILSHGPAVPDVTLVARVDRETLSVVEVRWLPTPAAMLVDDVFDGDYIHQLNGLLRDLAVAMVPARTWTGDCWSRMTDELITVVCRDGEPVISPAETQFYYGWRFSNHLTAALDCDIYVVTPQGWRALIGDWSGVRPALEGGAE